jgi:hypothetical protein
LEEDYAERPNISLNRKKYTLRPYACLLMTSGAIVVREPNEVPFTSDIS